MSEKYDGLRGALRCPIYPRRLSTTESECRETTMRTEMNSRCHAFRCSSRFRACMVCMEENPRSCEVVDQEVAEGVLCREHRLEGRVVVVPPRISPPKFPVETPWRETPVRELTTRVDLYRPELKAEEWRSRQPKRRPAPIVAAASAPPQPKPVKATGNTLTVGQRKQVSRYFDSRLAMSEVSAVMVAEILGLPREAVNAYWEELLSVGRRKM